MATFSFYSLRFRLCSTSPLACCDSGASPFQVWCVQMTMDGKKADKTNSWDENRVNQVQWHFHPCFSFFLINSLFIKLTRPPTLTFQLQTVSCANIWLLIKKSVWQKRCGRGRHVVQWKLLQSHFDIESFSAVCLCTWKMAQLELNLPEFKVLYSAAN